MTDDIRDEHKEPRPDSGAGQNPARFDSDRDYAARNHSEGEQSTSPAEPGTRTAPSHEKHIGRRLGDEPTPATGDGDAQAGWRATAENEAEQPGAGDPLGDGVR